MFNSKKEKTLEELIKEIPPAHIAAGLRRAEADGASADELKLYWKGRKSMLQNFVEDADFVAAVMDEFERYYGMYEYGETEEYEEGTDRDFDLYSVQVQNGDGFYNEDGDYVPFSKVDCFGEPVC